MRWLEKKIRAYFIRWHGEGGPNQYDFYRCEGCKSLLTWQIIRSGGCACGSPRLKPTNPTFFELVKVLVFPWVK